MGRFSITRNNFLGGELSLRGDGRVDLPQYGLGCKELTNFVPIPSGGVTRRPGTRHLSRVSTLLGGNGARILPFVYSNTDSYIVVISYDGVGGMAIRVFDASKDNLGVFNEYTVTFDPSTPPLFAPVNLGKIQFVQSADVMFLCVEEYPPFVIYRTGSAGSYVFNVSRFIDGGGFGAGSAWLRVPYLSEITSTTITPSATSGSVTLTASSPIFTSANIGSYYRITHGATDGYAIVTGFTSSTVVTATVLVTLGGTGASNAYAEGAWSLRRGYPRSLTFYNRRLLFGGTLSKPDTFWASQVSDFYQFEPIGTGPSDPQAYTLSSDKLNQIQWMVGGKKLTIGTIGGEHVGEFREDGTEIFVQFFQETTHGSSYVQPQRVAYAIPFIQRSGRRVRELVFDFNSDSYVANDLTLLKEDIAEGTTDLTYAENRLGQICYTEAPFPCIWAIDGGGKLYSCTRERNQQISAWATHSLGGRLREIDISGISGTDHSAYVTSICVTPSRDNTFDRLWMIVQRYINGESVSHIEYMDKYRSMDRFQFQGYTPADAGEGFFYFLDAAKHAYASPAGNLFTGFDHLKNEEVGVVVDGKYVGQIVVSNTGTITLPTGHIGSGIVAGYLYKSRLKTMRQEGGSAIGNSTGAKRRVDEIKINLFKSRFFKFGFESEKTWREYVTGRIAATQVDEYDDELEDFSPHDPGENSNGAFYAINDIVVFPAPNNSDKKSIATILCDRPYPCTILSITLRAVEQDV